MFSLILMPQKYFKYNYLGMNTLIAGICLGIRTKNYTSKDVLCFDIQNNAILIVYLIFFNFLGIRRVLVISGSISAY